MRPRIRTLIILFATAASSLALAGCGQKGNLYLPNQKKKVPATQPQQPQSPSQTSQPGQSSPDTVPAPSAPPPDR